MTTGVMTICIFLKKHDEVSGRHSTDNIITLLSLLIILIFVSGIARAERRIVIEEGIVPVELRCEFQDDPLGIDKPEPRLSWSMMPVNEKDRDQCQTAYRIQVASSLMLLQSGRPDLWDSHKIISLQNNNIHYKGKELQSGMKCYWRIKVWDKDGKKSGWSKSAYWSMGLLHLQDWQGKWIQDSKPYPSAASLMYGDLPAPVFRKEFITYKKVRSATLYVSGLGYYIAFINGKRVGDHVLDPGWTDYDKRIYYSTYDVTDLIRYNKNCVGIMLGNGWYNPLPLKMWGRFDLRKALATGQPKFILQLNIRYADGTTSRFVSDQSWKATDGPVIRNGIYLGVKYDDRKTLPGWNQSGFNNTGWRQVKVSGTIPSGKLQAQPQPPVIVADTLAPTNIKKVKPGTYLVDFGRNFGGIIRLKARGKSGTAIHMRYGELLYSDGTLNVMTSVAGQVKQKGLGGPGAPDTAYAHDIFILNGKGDEVFQPPFTFHGFRYVEISDYPGILKPENIQGLILHADVKDAGSFLCSDTLINKIQQACRNTFLSNLFSVQSDCPHRERFGYGGDILATCEAFMNNFDMSAFYAKTVQDYADAARPDGGLTETAPFVGIADAGLGGQSGPIEWGSVHPVLLYRLYEYYGNIELIRQQYATAKKWIDFISRHANHYIIDTTIGDHESIDPKVIALSGTAFYYYNAHLMVCFAKLLGKQQDEKRYSALANRIRQAFIQKFLQPGTGKVGIHTEAAQSYSLYFDLIPQEEYANAVKVLLNDIEVHQGHITTGMFGTKYMMEMLSRTGHGDIACQMADQRTFPGWGYMMASGATTIWEHWEFSDNTYSHNHPMFGSVSQWFYRHVAGIQPDTDAVAYNKIIIRPDILPSLTWAKANYYSINGLIKSQWEKSNGEFKLNVVIPVNTTARIYIPAGNTSTITESSKKVDNNAVIKFVRKDGSYKVYRIGSGNYHFVSSSFAE